MYDILIVKDNESLREILREAAVIKGRIFKLAFIFFLPACIFCLAGPALAGYCYECDICYRMLGGQQSIGPFASPEECDASRKSTLSEMGLRGDSVTGCQPCGGGDSASSGSSELNELVAKVLLSPEFTAEEKFMAASAPVLQGMLQGAIQGLFTDDPQVKEQRKLAKIRAEQARAEQEKLDNEKFAKVKSMLKQLSQAGSLTVRSIGEQGSLSIKKLGDEENGGMKLKKMDLDTPAAKHKAGGSAAFEQLKMAAYLSQKAEEAKTDEEAKAYADAAFGEAAGKGIDMEMPPEAEKMEISKEQVKEFEDMRDAFTDSATRLEMIRKNNEYLRLVVEIAEKTKEAAYNNEKTAKQKLDSIPGSDKNARAEAKLELEKAVKVRKEAEEKYEKWLKTRKNSLEQERMRRESEARARMNLQRTVNLWNTSHVKDITMHNKPGAAVGIPSGGKRGIGSPACGNGFAKVLDYGDFYYCCPQDHPYLSRCDEQCYTADDFNAMKIPCDRVLRTY